MRGARSFWRPVVGALAVAMGLLPAAAIAQGREEYKQGVEAFEAGRFEQAVGHLRAAIAERAEEKGGGFRRYFPYYYLGATLAELGDCPGSLAAFAESERQGQLSKEKDKLTDLQRRKRACQDRQQQVTGAAENARAALAEAESAEERIANLARRPEIAAVWKEGEPSLETLQHQAERLLRQVRQRLEEGEKSGDFKILLDVPTKAAQAVQAFEDIAAEAESRLGVARQATTTALQEITELEDSAQRVLRTMRDLSPYPPELGRRVAALEADLAEVGELKGRAGSAQLKALTDRLTVSLSQLRRAAQGPPERLAEAAEAFLAGELDTVLAKLQGQKYSDPQAMGHVCLLRSAAYFSQWVLRGEKEPELRTQAESALADCATLKTRVEPSPRFFSPRFIELYRALATGSGAAR